ncbi:rCG32211 [Rattus norvegicus]|uniref:RCG32211 n=1 Tax=Rattus norvegicus TaxID=10116 RepID=A6JXG5_RAT|nr:rCG32211 [Rattus norvegicus]
MAVPASLFCKCPLFTHGVSHTAAKSQAGSGDAHPTHRKQRQADLSSRPSRGT